MFVLYLLISILTCLTLFHIAILGFPLLGFMWTFFWFALFQTITLIEVSKKYKIETAILVMIYGYFTIFYVLFNDLFKEKNTRYLWFVISIIVLFICIIFTFFLFKKMLKEYWPRMQESIKEIKAKKKLVK